MPTPIFQMTPLVLHFFLLNVYTWGENSGFANFLLYYLNHGIFPGVEILSRIFCNEGITLGAGLAFVPFHSGSKIDELSLR